MRIENPPRKLKIKTIFRILFERLFSSLFLVLCLLIAILSLYKIIFTLINGNGLIIHGFVLFFIISSFFLFINSLYFLKKIKLYKNGYIAKAEIKDLVVKKISLKSLFKTYIVTIEFIDFYGKRITSVHTEPRFFSKFSFQKGDLIEFLFLKDKPQFNCYFRRNIF